MNETYLTLFLIMLSFELIVPKCVLLCILSSETCSRSPRYLLMHSPSFQGTSYSQLPTGSPASGLPCQLTCVTFHPRHPSPASDFNAPSCLGSLPHHEDPKLPTTHDHRLSPPLPYPPVASNTTFHPLSLTSTSSPPFTAGPQAAVPNPAQS